MRASLLLWSLCPGAPLGAAQDGRVVLGLGVSHRPLSAMRSCLEAMVGAMYAVADGEPMPTTVLTPNHTAAAAMCVNVLR